MSGCQVRGLADELEAKNHQISLLQELLEAQEPAQRASM